MVLGINVWVGMNAKSGMVLGINVWVGMSLCLTRSISMLKWN